MTIDEIQQSIIEEYSAYKDYLDKYQALMTLSRKAPKMPPELKIPDNLVNGCQNNVWLTYEVTDGKMIYYFDSEASIAKGIITLIMSAVSGQTPEDILNADLHFIEDIGLKDQMSSTRGNGMRIILEKIYEFAEKEKPV